MQLLTWAIHTLAFSAATYLGYTYFGIQCSYLPGPYILWDSMQLLTWAIHTLSFSAATYLGYTHFGIQCSYLPGLYILCHSVQLLTWAIHTLACANEGLCIKVHLIPTLLSDSMFVNWRLSPIPYSLHCTFPLYKLLCLHIYTIIYYLLANASFRAISLKVLTAFYFCLCWQQFNSISCFILQPPFCLNYIHCSS